MATSVVVGLSGGVDSSVAAALLQQQGYQVFGLTFWLMRGKGQCCSEGLVDAARICDQLGIPHDVVDSRETFKENIVDYLISGYRQGITPLPCSRCNKSVKFVPMLEYAQKRGIDKIATGHYCRISYNSKTDRYELRRAIDRSKDQSYFLYEVPQSSLRHCLFPLGELTKAQTREIAQSLGLATADKPDSQDLCLIEAHGSMANFLNQYIYGTKGQIVDRQGRVLGEHNGIHHYTIGQRKGLGIAHSSPLYVLGIDVGRNQVIVGERWEAEQPRCQVREVNWVSQVPTDKQFRAEVQIRYRSNPAPATLTPMGETEVKIEFDEPQFGITPGQAAVWYDDDLLLGGGIIASSS
ncbi:MAG: tRNA 2-thiouridine(34) synthase MnmA [Pseudanabaenaceae cyanobacterium SKYGB_i_bin29]|nr:tRNA 2-thiouridine(34) synthase MnmA [Pseudanabaenaceae cyanobacterium SKYG29]MDW8420410.1 tRNA 2-thiouridine(34) synthase MnmA [Pseudanabaenaceae cyanobacterium SKYGB_i_bin29]